MKNTLQFLKQHGHVRQGNDSQLLAVKRLPLNQHSADKALNGGIPESGLIHIRCAVGSGELSLLLPAIQQKCGHDKLLVLVSPPGKVNAHWLQQHQLEQAHCLIVSSTDANNALWSIEQCIRSGCAHTLCVWQCSLSLKHARRLQVLAQQHQCLLIVFSDTTEQSTLPVALDCHLAAQYEQTWLTINKQTGGWPSEAITLDLPLPATNQAIRAAFQRITPDHSREYSA